MYSKNCATALIVLLIALFVSDANSITRTKLYSIARKIISQNGLNYQLTNITVDRYKADGIAKVYWLTSGNRHTGQIYVDPTQMERRTENSWAMILGHELAHAYVNRSQADWKQEWDADVQGAKWAKKIGYKPGKYITSLLNDRNNCSPTHGCWHNRAKNLAEKLSLDASGWDKEDKKHKDHDSGWGLPPTTVTVPCTHMVISKQQVRCSHFVTRNVRGPCQHYANTPYGYRPIHGFDFYPQQGTMHQFDIVARRVPAHSGHRELYPKTNKFVHNCRRTTR